MPDIIIVEDNREIGTLLCDFLRKENYTVSLVDTGEKALQIFEQYGANLVVIDIGLPGVDGYSVCSKIRETSNAHIMIDHQNSIHLDAAYKTTESFPRSRHQFPVKKIILLWLLRPIFSRFRQYQKFRPLLFGQNR